MLTLKQVVDHCLDRRPSDFEHDPPKHVLVTFHRDVLLAVLAPFKKANQTATDIFAGVEASGAGSDVHIAREHLLDAFGVNWQAFDEVRAQAEAEAAAKLAELQAQQQAEAAKQLEDLKAQVTVTTEPKSVAVGGTGLKPVSQPTSDTPLAAVAPPDKAAKK